MKERCEPVAPRRAHQAAPLTAAHADTFLRSLSLDPSVLRVCVCVRVTACVDYSTQFNRK